MTTQIPEVNVLMYAFWDEMPNHRVAKAWLERARRSDEHTLGLLDIVLMGFRPAQHEPEDHANAGYA